MIRPRPTSILALGLVLAEAPVSVAQERAARPRVGLVLSGGGARGCAHVGVLQVIEELRIPIHCVAGTSMGSIVGGLYAYGWSPDRLEAEMTRAGARRPWRILLADDPERSQRTFRRKQEDFDLLVDFGLGFRDGSFRVPKGLVEGQNLELELLTLAAEAHDLASFDQLPLPFRAVAVELQTGAEVILGSGNLGRAMRASMSLPGIFAPTTIDGRELLDGGLVNNVPIDVARSLGAERLIVVDIGTPVRVAEVHSALGVSTQMVQILTQQNVDRSLATLGADDVFIQPDLGDITSSDFERAAESIEIGRSAALAASGRLRALSVEEGEFDAFLARQRRDPTPLAVRQVVVDNRSGLGSELVRSRVRVEAGAPLDLAALRDDLERIFGLGDFEAVEFELKHIEDGLCDVVVRVTDKQWGPTYFEFGLGLSSNLQGRSAFNAISQANVREVNDLGAEWRTEVSLGDSTGITSEFYQPLTPDGTWFVAPSVGAVTLESATDSLGRIDVRLGSISLDVGANLGTWGEIRIGYTRIRGDVDFQSVLPINGFDFDDAVIDTTLRVDTLDDAAYPSAGTRFVVEWEVGDDAFGADQDYQRLGVGGASYLSAGATTFGLAASYQTAISGTLPAYRTPVLGGFTLLSGLDRSSLAGQHAGLIAVLARTRVAGRYGDTFGFPLYVGGTFEAGNAWARRDDAWEDLILAGSAFVSLNTPVGPTYLAYGYAEGGERSFYLFVGQPF